MNRKEFVKTTLKSGACACAMMFMGQTPAFGEKKTHTEKKETQKETQKDSKEDQNNKFISAWTESLMLIMDDNLDDKTKKKILTLSGRKCAERNFKTTVSQYNGNVKELLASMEKRWVEKSSYDEKKGVITIHGKKYNKCFCPLAAGKQTFKTSTFCLCSIGSITEKFESQLGKKVNVELLNSVLTGSQHCAFKITIAS